MADKWLYSPDLGTIQVRDGHYYTEDGLDGTERELQTMVVRMGFGESSSGPDYASDWENYKAKRNAEITHEEQVRADYKERTIALAEAARAKLTEDEWDAIHSVGFSDGRGYW